MLALRPPPPPEINNIGKGGERSVFGPVAAEAPPPAAQHTACSASFHPHVVFFTLSSSYWGLFKSLLLPQAFLPCLYELFTLLNLVFFLTVFQLLLKKSSGTVDGVWTWPAGHASQARVSDFGHGPLVISERVLSLRGLHTDI